MAKSQKHGNRETKKPKKTKEAATSAVPPKGTFAVLAAPKKKKG